MWFRFAGGSRVGLGYTRSRFSHSHIRMRQVFVLFGCFITGKTVGGKRNSTRKNFASREDCCIVNKYQFCVVPSYDITSYVF